LAQINGHLHGKQQVPRRVDHATSEKGILIEHNLNDLADRIHTEKAADMKYVADHTQDAIPLQGVLVWAEVSAASGVRAP